MKFNKILAGCLSVTFLSLSVVAPVAANPENIKPTIEVKLIKDMQSYYSSFTGVVKEITDHHSIEGAKFIAVEDAQGAPTNIILADDTYVVDQAEITVGTEIVSFCEANKPMILIYPPQIKADVIAVKSNDQTVKVDVFDKNLVSLDNSLKLNITDETPIVLADDSVFQGELANHKLVVIYDASTKSIPAQTTPKKIIVLGAAPVDQVVDKNPDYEIILTPDVSKMNIVVNTDTVITSPKAFTNDAGVVMVPLRVIAEALGYEVTFNNESYYINVGEKAGLQISVYNYTNADGTLITLDTTPVLVDNVTYVPLKFFKEVLLLNNAYVFEGQIDINDGELMH